MTDDNRLEITLSERRPISIARSEWPVIARATWFSGEHECQANEIAFIKVRQHADGRAIVYGRLYCGPGGVPYDWNGEECGFLLDASKFYDDIVRAIRRCAGIVGHCGNDCVASLPAEVL